MRENVLNIIHACTSYIHTHAHTHIHTHTYTHTHIQIFDELDFFFQNEFRDKTKGNKREDKKKTIFISPFMRYKCVIPMVIDQETKEHEKQQKKEEKEEEGSTVKIEDKYVNEAQINESKNRVYEHFKQISQTNKQEEVLPKKKKKSKQLILSQVHGGKRKREFNIKNESQKKNDDNDFSMTPTPYLNAETMHISKKVKQEAQKAPIEKRKMQESLAQFQSNSQTVKSIR